MHHEECVARQGSFDELLSYCHARRHERLQAHSFSLHMASFGKSLCILGTVVYLPAEGLLLHRERYYLTRVTASCLDNFALHREVIKRIERNWKTSHSFTGQ